MILRFSRRTASAHSETFLCHCPSITFVKSASLTRRMLKYRMTTVQPGWFRQLYNISVHLLTMERLTTSLHFLTDLQAGMRHMTWLSRPPAGGDLSCLIFHRLPLTP